MNVSRHWTHTVSILSLAVLGACDRDRAATANTASPSTGVKIERSVEQAAADAGRAMDKTRAALDDASVTARVKTALIAEPGLSGMAIDVDTSQNVVTLKGSVTSDEQRERAEQIARAAEGVKEVKNNLLVKKS